MTALNSARVNSLLEEALWELANENETRAPEQADALLDSMIDAARANVMGGMMPEEAEILFNHRPQQRGELQQLGERR